MRFPDFFNVDSALLNHSEHGLLCGARLLHSSNAVAADRLGVQSHVLVPSEVVLEVVGGIINFYWDRPSCPNVSHSHLVHSKSSRLVGADVVCPAHDLTGGQLLDEVLVNEHSLD